MGIINAGTAVGGVMAPPLIALVITAADWRTVFYVTGVIGIAWSAWWWWRCITRRIGTRGSPRRSVSCWPASSRRAAVRAPPRWRTLLQVRQTWGS